MDIKKGENKRLKIKWKAAVPLLLILAAVLLNIAGWLSNAFCNWYVTYVFPLWVETYGRITGMLSFSIGEWMLYLAVLAVALFVVLTLLRFLSGKRAAKCFQQFYRSYAMTMLWIFSAACMIMTLNCLLLYHVSPMNERYKIGSGENREYGVEEITQLRDYIVECANELAPGFKRDENGYLLYEGNMKEEARSQMKRLGETYRNLRGYYPRPKAFYASDFFSQQYIMGYYFPFSMEANYNDRMYVSNMPVTMCHELSHLKGFILEDEANFIGYLACVGSEDPFFNYSAYLSVVSYLDRDFYKAIGKDSRTYFSHPIISEQVMADKKFLTEEEWEEVEETAILDTEVVKKASDAFLESNLTMNGVADGKISYSRVVDLLLQYYDGILY